MDNKMTTVCVVYHSGTGHTKKMAEANNLFCITRR